MGQSLRQVGDVESGQGGFGPEAGFFRGEAEVEGAEGHVLEDNGIKELVFGMLETKAHTLAQAPELRLGGDGLAMEVNCAACGGKKAGEQPQQGGLATAVGPDEADTFSHMEFEGGIAQQGRAMGIPKTKVLGSEERRRHGWFVAEGGRVGKEA